MRMKEGLVLLASLIVAAYWTASIGSASVSPLSDPAAVFGGAADKFSCTDACSTSQGNTNGSCIPSGTGGPIQCGLTNIGTICGEERKDQAVRKQCGVDPAGPLAACTNGIAADFCYKYAWCKCKRSGNSGSCDNVANPTFNNYGSEVSSADCP